MHFAAQRRTTPICFRNTGFERGGCEDCFYEDIAGRMRLQFWKDSIDDCYNPQKAYVLDHPVLKEVKNVIDKRKLNKVYLKRLVASRDRPPNQSFLTMKEMEDYAEQSTSSVYYILLEIFGKKDMNLDHAISHLGKAQGIANLLRAIPRQSRNAPVNIPQEVLIKHGVSQERIIRDQPHDKGVEESVFEVATVAHQHLAKARNLSKHVSRDVLPVFLPAVAVDRYLDRLRQAQFRLSDKSLQQRDNFLPIAYYWHKFRGKY
ncbi:NADH dehydrogenase (ubiquinone) complex I, assembly factor 6 homolog isoform X2 [Hermetia illucens]|uniref:NADH dehydrogenase (ubiquinone) complex I, assembly factor 6 homolog isoform X2 n=1 Tax=Hermetia illucens TaxID=343691 RepID=UPI0018CC1520|nr:NADH dehydrogenase (ubiquinone) complex I, assembly factor 6 homolog isoform X2 [Hermetia illucens]